MRLSELTLDSILKLIQTLFYIVAGTLAILTYRSAKRGLLNTVNTEYQKRVMDRLKELSDELASEFDPDSPNYWIKIRPVRELVGEIDNMFVGNKKHILEKGVFEPGIPDSDDY